MKTPKFLCQILAADADDEAEILIYDEIGWSWFGDGVTAKQFVKDLAELDVERITVRINSGGGDVFEGLAIFNALRRHDAMVTTEIDGIAASIASVIALAGEEVRIADNAFFMIHNPHGFAGGNASDMREFAELLDKIGGSLAGVYVDKSGQDVEAIQEWMDVETWFDAEEAKAAGFVDAITKGKEIHACADLSVFSKAPAGLVAQVVTQEALDALKTLSKIVSPVAAGGAEPAIIKAPNSSAPRAKGDSMSAEDKAAQARAKQEAADEARAEERTRIKSIRDLGREHDLEQSKIDALIDDGSSAQDAKDAILEQIKAKADASPVLSIHAVSPRADLDPQRGFGGHIEFFLACINSAGVRNRADVEDERLRPLAVADDDNKALGEGLAYLMPRAFNTPAIRAAAGSDEQGAYANPFGGFLVPDSTLPGMLTVPFEGDPTIGRTQAIPMATPTVKIPARTDKDHSTSVSGGFTVTRRPETVDFTSSRMTVEQILLQAASLVGLAFATEEILTDSAISFAALIDSGFRDQFMAHILNEKIRGNGPGEYEGILNALCKIAIAKESGQSANTIVYKNVLKMRARCWGYGNALWLANHDTLPELAQMSLAVGTGGAPVYVPGTFGGQPDTLLGRPIFYSEYPSTLGTAGDIILWNPTQYLEGVYQPLQSAESVHVRFVAHERAFKLWLRNAGASWWRSALTPAQGSNTLSPIVTLATRS